MQHKTDSFLPESHVRNSHFLLDFDFENHVFQIIFLIAPEKVPAVMHHICTQQFALMGQGHYMLKFINLSYDNKLVLTCNNAEFWPQDPRSLIKIMHLLGFNLTNLSTSNSESEHHKIASEFADLLLNQTLPPMLEIHLDDQPLPSNWGWNAVNKDNQVGVQLEIGPYLAPTAAHFICAQKARLVSLYPEGEDRVILSSLCISYSYPNLVLHYKQQPNLEKFKGQSTLVNLLSGIKLLGFQLGKSSEFVLVDYPLPIVQTAPITTQSNNIVDSHPQNFYQQPHLPLQPVHHQSTTLPSQHFFQKPSQPISFIQQQPFSQDRTVVPPTQSITQTNSALLSPAPQQMVKQEDKKRKHPNWFNLPNRPNKKQLRGERNTQRATRVQTNWAATIIEAVDDTHQTFRVTNPAFSQIKHGTMYKRLKDFSIENQVELGITQDQTDRNSYLISLPEKDLPRFKNNFLTLLSDSFNTFVTVGSNKTPRSFSTLSFSCYEKGKYAMAIIKCPKEITKIRSTLNTRLSRKNMNAYLSTAMMGLTKEIVILNKQPLPKDKTLLEYLEALEFSPACHEPRADIDFTKALRYVLSKNGKKFPYYLDFEIDMELGRAADLADEENEVTDIDEENATMEEKNDRVVEENAIDPLLMDDSSNDNALDDMAVEVLEFIEKELEKTKPNHEPDFSNGSVFSDAQLLANLSFCNGHRQARTPQKEDSPEKESEKDLKKGR